MIYISALAEIDGRPLQSHSEKDLNGPKPNENESAHGPKKSHDESNEHAKEIQLDQPEVRVCQLG
jgi:hypothetical protein